jgi:hypothetical protein
MTEERKVQLAVTARDDASAVFEKVGQGAQRMGQVVSQAGQAAGKGLDAVGESAKRSSDGLTREEGRMLASIRRLQVELQSIGKSASEKIQIKADIQGIDLSKLQPALAALRADEQAAAQLQAGLKAEVFVGDLQAQIAALREQAHLQSLSADEALRYKAALAGAGTAAEPLIQELRSLQIAQEAITKAARESAAAQKEAAAQAVAQENFLASLRDRAANAGLDPNAQLRARAQQLGVSEQAEPLIAQAVAAQALASQQQFISNLKQQSDAIGKTRADLLALRAAELGVSDAAAPMIARLREADKTHASFAATGKLSAYEMQQVAFQMHDFGVQALASGGNLKTVITAFAQQGSQLSGTFNGAGNAFRALLSLVTPMRAAMAGAAVSVGVLALAMANAETKARGLATIQAQLAGTGRADFFSTKELDDFTKRLSQVPGVTREAAREIVSEFSKVGGVGKEVFVDLAARVNDYAKATGKSIPEAARTLAEAFANPEKGAADLSKTLTNFPTGAQASAESLARLGRTAEAQVAMMRGLDVAIKGVAAGSFTPLQTSVDELRKSWERAVDSFDHSEGLRNLNALLGFTLGLVKDLVDTIPKLGNLGSFGGLGAIAAASTPFGLPGAIGDGIGSAVRRTILGIEPEFRGSGATGSFGEPTGAAGGQSGGANGDSASRDLRKRQLAVADAHKTEARQIKELEESRTGLNEALKESNRLYEEAAKRGDAAAQKEHAAESARLRDGISGINKQISSLGKGQGVLDAQLQAKTQAAQEALTRERETLAFENQKLQAIYQAGGLSLVDFYDQKRQAIERGTAAQIEALETERKAVEEHLAKSRDPDKKEQDRTRLAKIDLQEEDARTKGAREIELANLEQGNSYRQLSEQVLNYQANLKSLQGDELGAAKIRADIAQQQAQILAGQAAKNGNPISKEDQAATATAIQQTNEIADARNRLTIQSQQLSVVEDRIAMLQRTGAIGELEALQQVGAARAARLAGLEKEVQALEKLSAERPKDLQLQLDTSRARLELDNLKAQLDPLKEKFDGMFRDAGANLFSDLSTGKPLEAIRNFANSIQREISASVGRSLSVQVFGQGGPLGGAGGLLADLFGGKARTSAAADAKNTAQESFRLSEIAAQNAGEGKEQVAAANVSQANAAVSSANALTELAAAAQAAAVALRSVTGTPLPPLPGTTGDFARLDRGQRVGESTVPDVLADTSRSSERLTDANVQAASSVVRLASAAARGGDAMSLLPSVVQSIIAAASTAGAASSGGGFLGSLTSLFSGSSAAAPGFVDLGTASGADLALFYHSGGIVGQGSDTRPVPAGVFDSAPRFHSGGMVGSAAREPSLAANEVPAILMGGPKGVREEVLTADDPRHSDRITPELRQIILERRLPSEGAAAPSGGRPVTPAPAAAEPRAVVAVQAQPAGRQDDVRGYERGGFVETVLHRTMRDDRAGGAINQPSAAERPIGSLAHLVTTRLEVPTAGAVPARERAVQVAAPQIVVAGAPAAAIPPAHVIPGARETLRESSRTDRSSVERIREMVLRGAPVRGERGAPGSLVALTVAPVLPAAAGAQARDRTPVERAVVGFSTGGYTGDIDPREAAGVVHGREFVFSEPAVRAIGVDRLERLHTKAKAGQMEADELPGYYDGGYVSSIGERVVSSRVTQHLMPAPQQVVKAGDTHVTYTYPVTVQLPPGGMDRSTATQRGREIGRGIATATRRNG